MAGLRCTLWGARCGHPSRPGSHTGCRTGTALVAALKQRGHSRPLLERETGTQTAKRSLSTKKGTRPQSPSGLQLLSSTEQCYFSFYTSTAVMIQEPTSEGRYLFFRVCTFSSDATSNTSEQKFSSEQKQDIQL